MSFIRKQFYKKIFAKIEPERDFRKFTTKKKKKNSPNKKGSNNQDTLDNSKDTFTQL